MDKASLVWPESELRAVVSAQPHPTLFVTVSGAHLHRFPSADSDYDLRGAHILSATAVLGLDAGDETIEVSEDRGGVRVELVTHDVRKHFCLLLRRNGYVLEQIFSPLVIHADREHAELKEIALRCITRNHAAHYLGFAEQQWRLTQKGGFTVKAVLYLYRVLLTGIHLMRTGIVEAKIPMVSELIARKIGGAEKASLSDVDTGLHERQYHLLCQRLFEAAEVSPLPEEPDGRGALNDLLVRLRLESL